MRKHRGPALRVTVPSQEIEAAKREQHRRDSTKEHQQAHRAPEHRVGSGDVAGQRVVRKIVGVGVDLARPFGRAGPGSPRKERGQLAYLVWIVNEAGGEPPVATRTEEVI